MKNIITFLLSCISLTAVIGQVANDTRVTVLSQTPTETVVSLSLTGVEQHPVSTPQGEAVVVTFPEGTPLLRAGQPDLSKFATALMIPATGSMTVEIQHTEYQEYTQVVVAPSKGDLKRNVDPATVPYKYDEIYQQDAFFPGPLADLQKAFIMRDVRGQALWIYPVQYNPATKTLRVYTNITLRVYQTDKAGENEISAAADRAPSRAFDQMYRNMFVNYDEKLLSRSGLQPEKMLVIAKDELIPTLEPLLAWKRQSGVHTTLVPLSEIGASDAATINNFVKNHYTAEGITYLLLVGDESAIVSEMRLSGGTPYSCDNCFGYMEGDDHFSEVLVGRLHASNEAQLQIMVNRILEYEKNPLVDAAENWCATGMASASNEGQGIGDDNQADYEQGNEWKSKHLADGYEKYWEFYDGTHGGISPTPGDATADQAGNPVNTQLVDVMNTRGVSIYNYTGHGWEQGLVSGNFNVDAVSQLRNHHRYPILIAVACCAGNFTNGECLGEAWQRAGNPATGEAWGGIAGFFSSDYQSWAPPMEGQDGMNQYLFDADGIALRPNIGAMLAYGNALMIAAYAQGGEVMADFWNPFADPTTMPRTRLPQVMAVSHAAGAFIGANALSVSSDAEGALVALYWQGQTLAVAVVENGVANLEFAPLDNVGELTVTVSQFNYIPYQGTVQVTPAGGAFVVNQTVILDDATGNNNQKADYGETLAFDVTLANVGLAVAGATSATLSATDANIQIIDADESFGDLDPAAAVEKAAAFSFKVNDDVADGHVVNFKLHIEFNTTESFEVLLPVKLNAPKLSVTDFKIDDSQGGNGDGYLQSGETAIVSLINRNTGQSASPDATGVLSTVSPWLSIGPAVSVGSIAGANGTQTAGFQVTVAADAPQSAQASFHYQLEAGNYDTEADFDGYLINPIVENFETHTFDMFPWVMSGNKPWIIAPIGAYSGQYCSRSGVISHNQKSVMEIALNVSEAGAISFARKVNSEQDYDFLRFFIDGVEVDQWSGNLPWAEVAYPVAEGFHTFAWSYEKDELVSEGQDRAWVDEIILPPNEVVVVTGAPKSDLFKVKVSPNPAGASSRLYLEMSKEQFVNIDIYDGIGRLVYADHSETRLPAGGHWQPLDLAALPAGIYFVQVAAESGTRVVKLVKE
jgi:hypothetical protein